MAKKRTKFHPAMPPKKPRKGGEVPPQLAKARARRAVIIARVAAGMAKLAQAREGADMTGLELVPTIQFLPRPAAPLILAEDATSQYKVPPMKPPVAMPEGATRVISAREKAPPLTVAAESDIERKKARTSIAVTAKRLKTDTDTPRKQRRCSACGKLGHRADGPRCPLRLTRFRAESAQKRAA